VARCQRESRFIPKITPMPRTPTRARTSRRKAAVKPAERAAPTPDRLEVAKTYKLFIGGAFPRSESGRSIPVHDGKRRVFAHISHASRKDLRDAVEAARKALSAWSGATDSNRGQVLYRLAEMMEGKRAELEEAISSVAPAKAKARSKPAPAITARREVELSIDRLVSFAGWADKYAQVLGCNNPVAGPFYNFTIPEPTGVVAVVAPDEAPLLALISLIAPALCAGNTVVAFASEISPIAAAVLAEACATSDLPAGVVNLLTGQRAELIPHIASHRDIDAVHAANLDAAQATALRAGAAENVKRVTTREVRDWADAAECTSPWWIEPLVELKTVWHPSGA
jgi:acyl-CoA reductase-like NAD-dependent aldehyde dehydrogenase